MTSQNPLDPPIGLSSPPTLHTPSHNHELPANRLPPEILGEIFLLSILKPVSYSIYIKIPDRDLGEISRTTRCSIASTCRYWRQVAIVTPTLWNRIHIAFRPDAERNCSYTIPSHYLLSLESQRSLSRPKRLVLRWSLTTSSVQDDLYEYLRQHDVFSHCESLELADYSRVQCSKSLLSSIANDRSHLPLLRAFTVSDCRMGNNFDLSYYPNAQQVVLHWEASISNYQHMTSLVRLKYAHNTSVATTVGILRSNPRLEIIDLYFPGSVDEPFELSSDSIPLPNLRHLAFGSGSAEPRTLFFAISAPEIELLCISDTGLLRQPRRFPKLRNLQMDDIFDDSIEELTAALRDYPALVYLSITEDNMSRIIPLLRERDESGAFCFLPALRTLQCEFNNFEQASDLLRIRNADAPEQPGMVFVIYATNPVGFRSAPIDFRDKHPWSFRLQNAYDPFSPVSWGPLPSM